MKALLLTIVGCFQRFGRKGVVRVSWNYQTSTNCVMFSKYECLINAFEKVSRLPENCEIDKITYYKDGCEIDGITCLEDVCEITLKGN